MPYSTCAEAGVPSGSIVASISAADDVTLAAAMPERFGVGSAPAKVTSCVPSDTVDSSVTRFSDTSKHQNELPTSSGR